jgi:hypothetical protein
MSKKNPSVIHSIIFILSFMFLVNCFGVIPTLRMDEVQNAGILLPDLLPGKFGKLWVERTIQLKATFEGSQSSSGVMGGHGGGGFFPLIAKATFIDSSLIKCGLNDFETLLEMSENEKQEYAKIYKETYKIGSYHFFWLELQTQYTEEILDLNRWNFYLEDDKGNKYDPQEIVEYSFEVNNPFQKSTLISRDIVENKFQNLKISSKTILLYFPKVNINGENIVDNSCKNISLVVFSWDNKNVKNKGTWDL